MKWTPGQDIDILFYFSRVACFRDDIVFLIYLYQRWLYPVDQSRIDCSGMIEETVSGESTEQKISPKEAENKSENRTIKTRASKKKD